MARILKRDSEPFNVEEKAVNSGEGKVRVKWHVWDDAKKLNHNQVEIYSVMRAEEYYINQGYQKIASKYYIKKKIPIENCGVDSFFVGKGDYVVCESKFTRDEGLFEEWKGDKEKVWQRLGRYKAGGKKCRQMSWVWIKHRAGKAAKKPAGTRKKSLSVAEKEAIRTETARMNFAIQDEEDKKNVKRSINIYGAAMVPAYPGVYKFKSAEWGRYSSNELPLEWTLDIDKDAEFIPLEEEFDDWAETHR